MNRKTRIIVAVLSGWTFIHLFLLFKNIGRVFDGSYGTGDIFYPFTNKGGTIFWNRSFDSEAYDFTELMVYAGIPWLVFILYRFINKAKD